LSRPTLTEKQLKVYNFLQKALGKGIPPSVREICKETAIKSTSTVHGILNSLEENGYIQRDPRNSRSIRIAGAVSTAQVPVLGRVTAGQPILAVEDIEDYIPYASNGSQGLFALRVVGLSMKDVGILDGDIVIADKDAGWRSGDIVIGMDGEEATVKRLIIKNGQVIFMPENPDFDPIYPENPSVLGKVIGSYRRY
jgi:repressor LexA